MSNDITNINNDIKNVIYDKLLLVSLDNFSELFTPLSFYKDELKQKMGEKYYNAIDNLNSNSILLNSYQEFKLAIQSELRKNNIEIVFSTNDKGVNNSPIIEYIIVDFTNDYEIICKKNIAINNLLNAISSNDEVLKIDNWQLMEFIMKYKVQYKFIPYDIHCYSWYYKFDKLFFNDIIMDNDNTLFDNIQFNQYDEDLKNIIPFSNRNITDIFMNILINMIGKYEFSKSFFNLIKKT